MNRSTTLAPNQHIVAMRLTLTGRVQGIGVRPALARWAAEVGVAGTVRNTRRGVEIHVEGGEPSVGRFVAGLLEQLPAAAVVASLDREPAAARGTDRFSIEDANEADSSAPLAARVPPDAVVCDQCLAEVASERDRRAQYPFTSCTNCGPRYSIIEALPYERRQTSMAEFTMCSRCQAEYDWPGDRRFHAQTNACPACGPRVWLRDAADRIVARDNDAVRAAAAAIQQGRIVALLGLGGYQLVVDATSPDAVTRLRKRKRRQGKPLAVMVRSLDEAAQLAYLNAAEREQLRSAAGPIVVVRARAGPVLATDVSGGLNTIGLMLPTTPLHWLLLEDCDVPLVVTSGNREGEPLCFRSSEAHQQLADIADVWLEHDRPIRRPIDDSVVRVMAGGAATIRLARGLAPLPLPLAGDQPLVALGGHQKAALALANGRQTVLGAHAGDLETVAARERYVEQLAALCDLYGVDVHASGANDVRFVCDLHPEYFTTRWGEQQANLLRTQHHHAHVVAGMLEHNWLDREVLGVAFDGTGYGTDGTVWGGEFLRATAAGFTRVGHLRPFRLPGGERAVREPWRVATALVREAAGDGAAARLSFTTSQAASLFPVLERPALSPLTTSAGRLFDGVASLLLGIERCDFEGQAAMLLEAACDLSAPGEYTILPGGRNPTVLDWRPLVNQVLQDRQANQPPAVMAMRFHRGLAQAIATVCRNHAPLPIVLCGGVFQNRVLVELLVEMLDDRDQPVGLPGLIPANDGGLAAGQLAIAALGGSHGERKSCV